MKEVLSRAAAWFTNSRRAALQAVIATSTTLLVIVGAATPEQASALTDLGAAGLIAVQGVIGLFLLRRSEWSTWFSTSGRAVIYGSAVAVGVAGAAFGLWGDDAQAQIAAIATAILSILTAFVQVLNTQTLHLQLGEVTPTAFASVIESEHVAEIEADPATYAKERDPDAAAPLRIVVVGARDDSDAVVRAAVAPYRAGDIVRVRTAEQAYGIAADVVLTTVVPTVGLVDELWPVVALSTIPEPIRYVP